MTDTLESKLFSHRQWNPVQCPIRLEIDGQTQTAESLVNTALDKSSLDLVIVASNGQNVYIPFKEDRELFTANIAANPSTSSLISHCHFESVTEDGRHALSLCDSEDITGLLVTQTNRFCISTSSNGSSSSFILMPYVENNCDLASLVNSSSFSSRKKRQSDKQNIVIDRNPSYIKEHLDGRRRYVELALVADYSVYTKYDSDEKKVNDYIRQTMNILNSLYFPLNIRITLVHSEIWKKGDQIQVLHDLKEMWNNFMKYKKIMLKDHFFDTGYMLTTLKFDEGVVGKAYKRTMCSYDYSGGVYVDHNNDTVETVATLAYELGHTFGIDHDPNDKDVCYCPMPRCIMNPQSRHMAVSRI